MGLGRELLVFFHTYLQRRVQYVDFKRDSSSYVPTVGVPQGSVLGPLLFITDITAVLNVECLLYADDLKLFSKVESVEDVLILQEHPDALSHWCNVMSYFRKEMLNILLHDYLLC